jgi:outer membrane receptor for ferrienterochelin and colicins
MSALTKSKCKILILFFFLIGCCKNIFAQDSIIRGTVLLFSNAQSDADDAQGRPAIGANIYWLGASQVVVSNPLGKFEIKRLSSTNLLVISYLNYWRDTIQVSDTNSNLVVRIREADKKLKGVIITGKKATTEIAYLSASQMLKIGKGELLKAACCNLSESFETTPSVDVSYTDAITGQKQIQLLGLATPHTLFTQENIPNLRGLASIIGLNFTPGTWVSDMQLSKGAGSVTNGYEGVAGQINVELVKPTDKELLNINLYQSISGRSEGNVVLNKKWNEQTASGVMLHYKNQWYNQDHNKDKFADNPLGNQLVGLYRMQYFSKKGFEIQGITKFINSDEIGGQIGNGNNNLWKYKNKIQRSENSLKIGKLYTQKPWKSMGLQLSYINHLQNTLAGIRNYEGSQKSFYGNYIFQSVIGNTNHQYKIGTSLLADNYNEQIPSGNPFVLNRKESVVGIFTEHTYNYLDKFTLVSGLRVDHSNLFGTFFTPRFHLRYKVYNETTMRLNFGRAQRTASVMAENMNAILSNRKLIFEGDSSVWQQGLQPEVTYNYGGSIIHPFIINYRKGSVMLDVYYSTFKQQWLADFETPHNVLFYNLTGNSFAKSIQLQTDYEVIRKKLDIRIAYRYYNIETKYRNTDWLSKPLVSAHRAFINIGYSTKSKWKWDATAVWHGKKRLPNFYADNIVNPLFTSKFSPNFYTINTHISKQISTKWNVYVGGENLTNFSQHHAIISSADIAAPEFDATQIWGPIMGINIYGGVRYSVKE